MEMIAAYKEVLLLAALVAWWLARRSRGPWLPWVGAQLILALAVEVLGKVSGRFEVNNHGMYNAYMLGEFVLLSIFLRRAWPRTGILHGLEWVSFIVFGSVLLWDSLSRDPLVALWSSALVVGGAFLGIRAAAILFFMASDVEHAIMRVPVFWVLLSIMVYFFCSIPILGLYNHLIERDSPLADKAYSINDLLFVLRYGLVLAGLLLQRQRSSEHDGA